jgi:hypothetical protein
VLAAVPVTVVVADEPDVELVEPDADDEEPLDVVDEPVLVVPDVLGAAREALPPPTAAALEDVEVW